MDVERGVYGTNNQPKRATFKFEKERLFCLCVVKAESKEYGKITYKHCPVSDYTGKKLSPYILTKKKPKNNPQ